NAALASENVEAYIRALDRNIYKEEIIAEIRRRQKEALDKENEGHEDQLGIIEDLEKKIKEYGQEMKKAHSITEIRRLQHELERVQIQLDKVIKDPSSAPTPIKIPIEIIEPDLALEQFAEKILAIQPKGLVIPVEVEIPEDKVNEVAQKSAEAGV